MARLIGTEYTPRAHRAEPQRRLTLDADFDQALLRLAAARLQYEELASHGGSFAARLDALDQLVVLRTEIRGLRTGAGLEL